MVASQQKRWRAPRLDRIMSLARAWFTTRLAQSITALHKAADHLWKETFLTRCAQHMLSGGCPRQQRCLWKHERPTSEAYKTKLERLLWLNTVFCALTPLFYRRVMSEGFQEKFLPVRRTWQERLVAEITWVSAYEQDDVILRDTLFRLRVDEALSGVTSDLKALLYFRLRREWDQRKEYSSLVEQIQLARVLGAQDLFYQALSHIIRAEINGTLISKHLDVFSRLERGLTHLDASSFVSLACRTCQEQQ